LPGGYSNLSKTNPDLGLYIYLFKCWDNQEEFFKVGLSLDPLKRSRKIPYEVEILSGNLGELFEVEQEWHKKFKLSGINYRPTKKFKGWTECFAYENRCNRR
jgi:hypothetical protein